MALISTAVTLHQQRDFRRAGDRGNTRESRKPCPPIHSQAAHTSLHSGQQRGPQRMETSHEPSGTTHTGGSSLNHAKERKEMTFPIWCFHEHENTRYGNNDLMCETVLRSHDLNRQQLPAKPNGSTLNRNPPAHADPNAPKWTALHGKSAAKFQRCDSMVNRFRRNRFQTNTYRLLCSTLKFRHFTSQNPNFVSHLAVRSLIHHETPFDMRRKHRRTKRKDCSAARNSSTTPARPQEPSQVP